MQQICRRTIMQKCDFNRVQTNFIEITLRHGCSTVIFCIFSEHFFLKTPLNGFFNELDAEMLKYFSQFGTGFFDPSLFDEKYISIDIAPDETFEKHPPEMFCKKRCS